MKKIGLYLLSIIAVLGLASCTGNKPGSKPDVPPTPNPETYTVTYDVMGHGTAPSSVTDVTSLPAELPIISADGFDFMGWYLDENFSVNAIPSSSITEDTTLYAKWVEIVYTYNVIYDANGHGSAPASISGVTNLPETLPTLTHEGYVFVGWYYDENCTVKANALDELTANVVLYAKWEVFVPTYDLTFNVLDKCVAPESLNVSRIPQDLPTPQAEGWTFEGWYYDEIYLEPVVVNDMLSSNTQLYAKWEVASYSVSFNANGGSLVESQTISHNQLVVKPVDPTNDGYIFGGWYKEAEFTNAWDFATDLVTTETTLYAKWIEIITYTLTYVSTQGTAPQAVSGITSVPTLETLSASGYTFGGWFYDEACTAGNEVEAGDTLTANTTIYAKWTENVEPEVVKFDINFISNGGTLVASLEVVEGETITKPADPVKSGSRFAGWYADELLTTPWDFENNEVTEDITLYAKWEIKSKYDELVEQQDILVINNDFNSYTSTDRLPEFTGIWGTKGIYSFYNNKNAVGSSSTNYVSLGTGKAVFVDPNNDGTQLVIDYGTPITSGVVEGYLEMTFNGQGNSWTPLQFYNGEETVAELFGIRIDDGMLKYRINGTSTYLTPETAVSSENNVEYKVHFVFDIDNQKFTMTINENPYVTNIDLTIPSLGGIKLVSSDNGSKLIVVDNVAVINENLSLAEYQVMKVNQLNNLYNSYNIASDYPEAETTLLEIKNSGVAAINAATSKVLANSAYNTAVANLESGILSAAKTKYSSLLNSIDKSNYTINLSVLNNTINNGVTAINAATTISGVLSAYEIAYNSILEIEDDADALGTLKENSIIELKLYRAEEGFTVENTSYQTAINNGVAAINAATTIASVNTALAQAKLAIDDIKSDAEYIEEEKQTALADLLAIKNEALADLNTTEHQEFISQINTAYSNGVAVINEADTILAVQTALTNASTSIDTIHSAATMTLEEAKLAAKEEIAQYATNIKNSYSSDSLVTDIDNALSDANTDIDSKTTNIDVLTALNNAKEAMDDIVAAFEATGGNIIIKQGEVEITSFAGTEESAYLYFNKLSQASDYKVYVKGPNYENYTLLTSDNLYISTPTSNTFRADLIGFAAGEYLIKIVPVIDSIENETASSVCRVSIYNYDRSGYAHYKATEGVGAYNNDGTLKENAIVLYVTDDNKNSVSVTLGGVTVTGIGNILNSVGAADPSTGLNSKGGTANTNQYILKLLADANIPLVVRFVGTVSNTGLYEAASFTASKTPLIEGLTYFDSIVNGGSVGDNGHMARMSSGKNITLEGIGDGAIIDGWGFHFICHTDDYLAGRGRNFEVRNLKFINVPEDCVGMEGQQESNSLTAPVERCWVHNCEFISPIISGPAESDKDGGDGACDFKRGNYFTNSYCYYNGYHKTNLVGSSDDSLQYHITYHHNLWKNCESRGPLARNANIHMYNNVFMGQSSYAMNPRANAYIYSEYNMFIMTKNPMDVRSGGIKSYNDMFVSITGECTGTVVTDKSQTVSTSNKYANFDTNSELSYIPSEDYILETDLLQLRKILFAKCGVRKVNINVEDVTMDDISLLSTSITPTKVTSATTLAPGKTKDVYAFEIDKYYSVSFTNAGTNPALLCNEAGILLSSGKAVVLAPGTYFLISSVVDTGNSNSSTIVGCAFKEFNVSALVFEDYDSEELEEQMIEEYNTKVNAIPTTITYTDSCYNTIKSAIECYNSLGELKSEVDYTKVSTAYNTYINLGKADVEAKINAIGTVGADSGSLISTARSAYNKLIEIDNTVVISNYSTLTQAEDAFSSYAITSFKNKVNAIGTVTISSGDLINQALNEYDGLSSLQKEEVSSEYQELLEAQATYTRLINVKEFNDTLSNVNLENSDSLKEVIDSYSALTTEEVAMLESTTLEAYSNVKVKYAIVLIDAIGTVSNTSGPAIEAADAAYNALNTSEKELVTNYQTLVDAKEAYSSTVQSYTINWTYTTDGSSKTGTSSQGFTHSINGGSGNAAKLRYSKNNHITTPVLDSTNVSFVINATITDSSSSMDMEVFITYTDGTTESKTITIDGSTTKDYSMELGGKSISTIALHGVPSNTGKNIGIVSFTVTYEK